ncbi:GAF domain-containing protein [Capronia epimyces CBS 606.96]|uniref:GAF domain-containing protein n=1 Tax=Capronia epimyces CBS 606.96 TaxID=1182542 RepID=W9XPA8_9EURO|nr:GAF domain-containing protein [Capronia epimyces CBS 606.96]EXJ82342.1 GAF domain-containing protein [Capronia epimyces CBS 606.96]
MVSSLSAPPRRSIHVHPHADAANFSSGLDKPAAYAQLLDSLTTLVADQRNWVANTANTASLLWHLFHSLPGPSAAVNWSGFYVLDPLDQDQLILGPFMGKVACQTIRIGKGVCGAAAQQGTTVLVKDVDQFPGHIACDGDSRSEIVVPIKAGGKVVGVIDIDCAEVGGFDEQDQKGLESIADLLAKSSDW